MSNKKFYTVSENTRTFVNMWGFETRTTIRVEREITGKTAGRLAYMDDTEFESLLASVPEFIPRLLDVMLVAGQQGMSHEDSVSARRILDDGKFKSNVQIRWWIANLFRKYRSDLRSADIIYPECLLAEVEP